MVCCWHLASSIIVVSWHLISFIILVCWHLASSILFQVIPIVFFIVIEYHVDILDLLFNFIHHFSFFLTVIQNFIQIVILIFHGIMGDGINKERGLLCSIFHHWPRLAHCLMLGAVDLSLCCWSLG